MHPSGKFLYAANFITSPSVVGYTIDQDTGALSQNSVGSADTGVQTAQFVTLDPQGKFLYYGTFATETGNAQGGIVIFQVDSTTGALTQVGVQPTDQFERSVISGDGKFLERRKSGRNSRIQN